MNGFEIAYLKSFLFSSLFKTDRLTDLLVVINVRKREFILTSVISTILSKKNYPKTYLRRLRGRGCKGEFLKL